MKYVLIFVTILAFAGTSEKNAECDVACRYHSSDGGSYIEKNKCRCYTDHNYTEMTKRKPTSVNGPDLGTFGTQE